MQRQICQFDVDESFDAMTERTGVASFHITLEQAPARPVVVFGRAWPPPAWDLHLGTALLVPLIESLDEVDGTADFELYHVWSFGICNKFQHRRYVRGYVGEQKGKRRYLVSQTYRCTPERQRGMALSPFPLSKPAGYPPAGI